MVLYNVAIHNSSDLHYIFWNSLNREIGVGMYGSVSFHISLFNILMFLLQIVEFVKMMTTK